MRDTEKIAVLLKELNKKAILNLRKRNFKEALLIFEKCFLFEEKLGFKEQSLKTLINIANTYYLEKEYKKTILYLEKALNYLNDINNKELEYKIFDLMGNTYFIMEDLKKASDCFLSILNPGISESKQAALSFKLTIILLKQKKYRQAEVKINKALFIFEKLKKKKEMINSFRQRAVIYKKTARRNLAINDLKKALTLAAETPSLKKIIEKELKLI